METILFNLFCLCGFISSKLVIKKQLLVVWKSVFEYLLIPTVQAYVIKMLAFNYIFY